MVSNLCSTFSWYRKSKLADTETGPQPFNPSYGCVYPENVLTVLTKWWIRTLAAGGFVINENTPSSLFCKSPSSFSLLPPAGWIPLTKKWTLSRRRLTRTTAETSTSRSSSSWWTPQHSGISRLWIIQTRGQGLLLSSLNDPDKRTRSSAVQEHAGGGRQGIPPQDGPAGRGSLADGRLYSLQFVLLVKCYKCFKNINQL